MSDIKKLLQTIDTLSDEPTRTASLLTENAITPAVDEATIIQFPGRNALTRKFRDGFDDGDYVKLKHKPNEDPKKILWRVDKDVVKIKDEYGYEQNVRIKFLEPTSDIQEDDSLTEELCAAFEDYVKNKASPTDEKARVTITYKDGHTQTKSVTEKERKRYETSSSVEKVEDATNSKGRIDDDISEDRKVNALWAQINEYETRAKETKNNIKKTHLMTMAADLRKQLPVTEVSVDTLKSYKDKAMADNQTRHKSISSKGQQVWSLSNPLNTPEQEKHISRRKGIDKAVRQIVKKSPKEPYVPSSADTLNVDRGYGQGRYMGDSKTHSGKVVVEYQGDIKKTIDHRKMAELIRQQRDRKWAMHIDNDRREAELRNANKLPQPELAESDDNVSYEDLSHIGLEGPYHMKSGQVVYFDPDTNQYCYGDTGVFITDDDLYDISKNGLADTTEEITEGTWSLPDTPEQLQKLNNILSTPLPASKATATLYHILGDDDLFDYIDEMSSDYPDADFAPFIKYWISQHMPEVFAKLTQLTDINEASKSENRALWDKINSKGIVPSINRERYTDLSHEGLEGPFRLKNGLVVYYDPKEGKYYNRDSDMYLSYDEYEQMNESIDEFDPAISPSTQAKREKVPNSSKKAQAKLEKIEKMRNALNKLQGAVKEARNKMKGSKLDEAPIDQVVAQTAIGAKPATGTTTATTAPTAATNTSASKPAGTPTAPTTTAPTTTAPTTATSTPAQAKLPVNAPEAMKSFVKAIADNPSVTNNPAAAKALGAVLGVKQR